MSGGIEWHGAGQRGGEGAPSHIPSPFLPTALAGLVVLVTGGGSGIGLAIARQLGLHGASVAIMGRTARKLEDAAESLRHQGVRAVAIAGDVRKPEDAQRVIASVVAQFGRLDVLVNNAAGNFLCLAEDLSTNAFRTVVDIDLVGTFCMSTSAREALQRTRGCIINISATLHYGATQYVMHASAAKAGVDAVTRGLATEWQEYGIRVNGIAPGPIRDTVGMDRLGPLGDHQSPGTAHVRMGEKDEVALTAVFLCTKAAGYINGESIVVDGGTWMLRPTLPKEIYHRSVRQAKL